MISSWSGVPFPPPHLLTPIADSRFTPLQLPPELRFIRISQTSPWPSQPLSHRCLILSDIDLLTFSTLRFHPSASNAGTSTSFETSTFPLSFASESYSHARAVSISRFVYLIGQGMMIWFNVSTGYVTVCAEPLFPCKKFAAIALDGRIFVAGGPSRTSAVEEYDPETDSWHVIGEAPCRRYGCVGATVSGIFYIAGGLRTNHEQTTVDACICARSFDAYHIASGTWLRTHSSPLTMVPTSGCIFGACGISDMLYIMASHALEVSFWRWNREVSTLSTREAVITGDGTG